MRTQVKDLTWDRERECKEFAFESIWVHVRTGKSVRHGKTCKKREKLWEGKGEKLQKGKEDMKRKTKRHKDAQDKDTRDLTCTRKQEKNKAHSNERERESICILARGRKCLSNEGCLH